MLNVFKGKTVIVTGHTGFKGSWLTVWLNLLGAKVVGISLENLPTSPSHFGAAQLSDKITDYRIDIRDFKRIKEVIIESNPDFLFHLAAQPLVRESYKNPIETYEVNIMGTIHILESLRSLDKLCSAVFITSDKCYDNVEWIWGYRENDRLGGPDPYSASKGATEIAIRSYVKSFFPANNKVRISVGRAGNVIGGGDWAADRIVPDCVIAWSGNKIVELRSPFATRPWQHVLEPLSGYINLGVELYNNSLLHGEAFNFGPPASQNHTVLELVQEMSKHWDKVRWEDISQTNEGPYESGLLKLNCDKALHHLNWEAVMNFSETVKMTSEWYKAYYNKPTESIYETSATQILDFMQLAKQNGLKWAQ